MGKRKNRKRSSSGNFVPLILEPPKPLKCISCFISLPIGANKTKNKPSDEKLINFEKHILKDLKSVDINDNEILNAIVQRLPCNINCVTAGSTYYVETELTSAKYSIVVEEVDRTKKIIHISQYSLHYDRKNGLIPNNKRHVVMRFA